MIMRMSNFENDIVVSDEYVRVLEIEDKKLFINIVQSIHGLCYNKEGTEYIVLLDGDRQVDFAKDVYFIIDALNLDLNDRKILSKLYLKMKNLLELEHKIQLDSYLKEALDLINTVFIEFPFELTYKSEIQVEDFLKLYGFRLYTQEESFMEQMLYLIDLISLLGLCKVLIFCNIKSFFTDEQIEEIYKYVVYNKLHVLLVEGNITEELLPFEKKIRIDGDFEDYEIK